MARVTVLACDECASQDQVKHYEVKEGTRKAAIDLCGAHSGRVEQLLGKPVSAGQKGRATRSRARKTTTMEEIEALKKS